MASVVSSSAVSNNLRRSLSNTCSSQSFEDSSAESVLDIFGNLVFSRAHSENEDQLSQSWYRVSNSETHLQGGAKAVDHQVVSGTPDRPVPNNVSFTEQCLQIEEKAIEQPVVAEIHGQNGTNEDQKSHTGIVTCNSSIMQASKPLGARPKIFNHGKSKTCITSREGEKVKKELSADEAGASQVTSRAKGKKKKVKIRTKSTKKWKPVDISEFGFNFLLVSQLDFDETEIDEESDNTTSDLPVPPESALNLTSSETSNDDAEFFLALGIDVYADYDDSHCDSIIDWDGVKFSNQSLQAKDKLVSKPQEKPRKGKSFVEESKSSPPNKDKTVRANSKLKFKDPQSSTPQVDNVIRKCDKYSLYELECSSRKKVYIRRDKHRRVEKAHKAVKSKNLVSIFNNRGRKRLYMHHRLVKMHDLCLDFRSSPRRMPLPPMSKSQVDLSAAKQIFKVNRNTGSSAATRGASAQNLRHTLHETNAPNHLDLDLASFLISLQHREMTPEDYEMLLRLDDTVKPKTVSKNILENLKTDTVGPEGVGAGDDIVLCAICMEPYVTGDKRKFLPCGHDFHSACVDTWLKNSSMNCPLDGLPIESS